MGVLMGHPVHRDLCVDRAKTNLYGHIKLKTIGLVMMIVSAESFDK